MILYVWYFYITNVVSIDKMLPDISSYCNRTNFNSLCIIKKRRISRDSLEIETRQMTRRKRAAMDILPVNFKVLWFCGAWKERKDDNIVVACLHFCYKYLNV